MGQQSPNTTNIMCEPPQACQAEAAMVNHERELSQHIGRDWLSSCLPFSSPHMGVQTLHNSYIMCQPPQACQAGAAMVSLLRGLSQRGLSGIC